MKTVQMRLVTIIAEHVLRDRIVDEIRRLGAHGYTLTEVRGEGTRGIHASEWQGGNAKIEALVAPEVAERILEHMAGSYFRDYAVVAYVTTVEVVRGEKFA
jgi:nitrogen regulatory protein P-II 2